MVSCLGRFKSPISTSRPHSNAVKRSGGRAPLTVGLPVSSVNACAGYAKLENCWKGTLTGIISVSTFRCSTSWLTFPDDEVLQQAVRQHWGLRVLRQEPWETLASFIASSTKQIIQIRQIVENLSRRFGQQLDDNAYAFPPVAKIASATLPQLRACKLGFRAEYLRAAARLIDTGKLRLDALPVMEYERALEELQKIHGVGEKIANCTLLFSCGFEQAFPVDVWMQRSLHRLGWRSKKITRHQILNHFGPYAGWSQQYLFYSERSS